MWSNSTSWLEKHFASACNHIKLSCYSCFSWSLGCSGFCYCTYSCSTHTHTQPIHTQSFTTHSQTHSLSVNLTIWYWQHVSNCTLYCCSCWAAFQLSGEGKWRVRRGCRERVKGGKGPRLFAAHYKHPQGLYFNWRLPGRQPGSAVGLNSQLRRLAGLVAHFLPRPLRLCPLCCPSDRLLFLFHCLHLSCCQFDCNYATVQLVG